MLGGGQECPRSSSLRFVALEKGNEGNGYSGNFYCRACGKPVGSTRSSHTTIYGYRIKQEHTMGRWLCPLDGAFIGCREDRGSQCQKNRTRFTGGQALLLY